MNEWKVFVRELSIQSRPNVAFECNHIESMCIVLDFGADLHTHVRFNLTANRLR